LAAGALRGALAASMARTGRRALDFCLWREAAKWVDNSNVRNRPKSGNWPEPRLTPCSVNIRVARPLDILASQSFNDADWARCGHDASKVQASRRQQIAKFTS
jgi:hypothetical protein